MEFETPQNWQNLQPMPNGVRGFFAWLVLWFRAWTGDAPRPRDPWTPYQTRYAPNRHWRRLNKHPITAETSLRTYRVFCRHSLTPGQFMERQCALSGRGRVRIYGLSTRTCVLIRRSWLKCYDHGWWRAPIGRMGRVFAGLWAVHTPP